MTLELQPTCRYGHGNLIMIDEHGLPTPHLFSDLWLRHLAVTLDFGNNVFPVHAPTITDYRYFGNAFLLSLFRKL